MAVKKEIEINVNSKGATKGIDDVSDSIEGASEATSGLSGSLDKMTGGAISAFKGIVSGVKKGVLAMKTLKTAIAATGIGILVIAVGALTAAFRSSEEGQNKFAKIMGVIGSITDNLIDLLADLGETIIDVFTKPKKVIEELGNSLETFFLDKLDKITNGLGFLGSAITKAFAGDFKGAIKDAGKGVVELNRGLNIGVIAAEAAAKATAKFTKELVNEGKAAGQVADMRAKADKIERNLLVERSKLESDIAALRLKSRQEEEFSAEERKKALVEAQALEDSLLQQETEYLTLRAEAQTMENTFARSNKENLDAEANAIAAVNRMNAARLNQQRSTQRELNRVNKEIERDKTAALKETEAAQKEADKIAAEALKAEADARKKITEATLDAQDLELLKTTEKYAALIAEAEKYGIDTSALVTAQAEDVNNINAKYDKIDSDRKKKKADDDKAVNEATLNAIGGALGSLSELAGKDAAAGKALSAAQAVINTYTGATKALSQGGIAGPIAAAGVIASGIVSIRKIYATKLPATAGGSGGSGSAPRITAPSITPRLTLDTQVSDLGNQITGSLGKAPLRAYVVNQDVQNAAQMDRKIRQTATIG
tara:strand:+ start:18848 stop:20647 length:1800 start_codon:yes stop_codon:yes gene_type:complete